MRESEERMVWENRIRLTLQQIKERNNYRQRIPLQSSDGGRIITIEGRDYLNFSSNDYLGLSHSKELIAAWQEGVKSFGVGSGGSGHVVGYHQPLAEFEETLADWLGYERAILFSSGFSANQAIINTLLTKEDSIIADRLSHASLLEAAFLSPARLRRFHHNGITSLAKQLSYPAEAKLVVTEGIFSMDGDEAPLSSISELVKKEKNAWLLVDDAHGIGVQGRGGRGTCDKYGIKPELLVVTFGKAFGMSGAAILMSDYVAEYFTQKCRALIYSTAPAPAHAYALQSGITLIQQSDDLRAKLRHNIEFFQQRAKDLALNISSNSAIQPIIIGSSEGALALSKKLREEGIWVNAIRPPTVPQNSARLRVTLTANHTTDDINRLLERIYEYSSK